MFPDKPVLWLSQSLHIPRDRAKTVENTTLRVVTMIVSIWINFHNISRRRVGFLQLVSSRIFPLGIYSFFYKLVKVRAVDDHL